MTSWHSYPKVWAIGHAGVKDLFLDEVIVEEKIDGSQFSFGKFGGEIKVRSKGVEMLYDAPEKMFSAAVRTVESLKHLLLDGYTYRAEYLQKPKHNVLVYDRVPVGNLIIFDINQGHETYLDYTTKKSEADRLGLECVPVLFEGKVSTPEEVLALLERTSCLGGQKIEGVVCKNYARFGNDKKVLMGKFVSEHFKEKHKVDWKEANPGQHDIIQLVINQYRTPARWDKAIIHLKEAGVLENSPRDIGKLFQEVPKDLLSEAESEIKDTLFKWAFPTIQRGLNRGLAEYYKEYLLKSQFEAAPAVAVEVR